MTNTADTAVSSQTPYHDPAAGTAAADSDGSAAAAGNRSTWSRPVIALRDVAARVGGRTLWSGVDLDIAPGEFVAILGPNGVGKSTLIKIVLGLLPAAAGTVRVLDAEPGQASDRVGYLPQRRSFDAALRIRGIDVVRLGLDGDRWGLPLPGFGRARHKAAQARVAEVIELVGASGYAHRPIGSSPVANSSAC